MIWASELRTKPLDRQAIREQARAASHHMHIGIEREPADEQAHRARVHASVAGLLAARIERGRAR